MVSKSTVRRRVDWPAVQRDYRTGMFTQRELAAKYGCTHTAIAKQAKKHGWQQDLSKEIRAATRAKLVQSQSGLPHDEAVTETVLATAELNKHVILGHRADIKATRDIAIGLLGELQRAAITPGEQEQFLLMLAGESDQTGDINEVRRLLQRLASLGGRILSIKTMADALTKLQTAERVAFNLDDKEGEQKPELAEQLAQFIGEIHESSAGRLPMGPRQPLRQINTP